MKASISLVGGLPAVEEGHGLETATAMDVVDWRVMDKLTYPCQLVLFPVACFAVEFCHLVGPSSVMASKLTLSLPSFDIGLLRGKDELQWGLLILLYL